METQAKNGHTEGRGELRRRGHAKRGIVAVLRIAGETILVTEGSHNGKRVVLIDAPPGVELGFVRKEPSRGNG